MTMISIAHRVDPRTVASRQPQAVADSSPVLLLAGLLLALLIGAGGA